MGMMNRSMAQMMVRQMAQREDERSPSIAKNTILRDKVNDEQVRLAKRGPMMIRNPKKTAKGA